LVVSYESAHVGLTLGPGTYFALFAAQGDDAGFLLGRASSPFTYEAGSPRLGFLQPQGASNGQQPAAVRILGVPATIAVAIDVKPGSSTHNIDLGSHGKVPVAILGTASFDVRRVDPTSVTLAGA